MEITVALSRTGKLASPRGATLAWLPGRSGWAVPLSGCWSGSCARRVGAPGPYANVYDPLEPLAYVAAITERVRLGTSIMDALFHVPAILARRFATLDRLSGGRVIAGLGQGYALEEFAAANASR